MSTATENFDPYRDWLGIEPWELPADHYRLLGLARFEADPVRIAAAADERMMRMRAVQAGPRGAYSHKLLNELATAKLCLLSPPAKAQYDLALHARLMGQHPPAPAVAYVPGPGLVYMPAPMAVPMYPVAGGVPTPTLSPPLAAPPVSPPVPHPPQAGKPAEPALQLDLDHEPEPDELPERRSLLGFVLGTLLVIALVAGVTWGVGMYLAPGDEPEEGEIVTGEGTAPVGEETKPPEEDPADKAVLVMQEGSERISFTPGTAVVTGNLKVKPTGIDTVMEGFTAPADVAIWKFKVLKPGFFKLELDYAATEGVEGASLQLELEDKPLRKCDLHSTGGRETFAVDDSTVVLDVSGTHTLRVYPSGELPPGALVLRSIRLTPLRKGRDAEKK